MQFFCDLFPCSHDKRHATPELDTAVVIISLLFSYARCVVREEQIARMIHRTQNSRALVAWNDSSKITCVGCKRDDDLNEEIPKLVQ